MHNGPKSIRGKITLTATLVTMLAMVVIVAMTAFSVRHVLSSAIHQSLYERLDEARIELAQGDYDAAIDLVGNDMMQVIDESGSIVAGTRNTEGLAAISTRDGEDEYETDDLELKADDQLSPSGTAGTGQQAPSSGANQAGANIDPSTILPEGGPYLVEKLSADTPDGPMTLVGISSIAPAVQTAWTVAGILAIIMLSLVCIVAAFVWHLTARTLKPVETMSAAAAAITAANMNERIEVPEGDAALSQLAMTFNDLLDRVEASLVEQRRFVSDASHELKSPIAATSIMLETLRTHPEAVDINQAVNDLSTENDRMAAIVGDLLVLARSDEGRMKVSERQTDLMDLLFEEAAGLRLRTGMVADVSELAPCMYSLDPGLFSHAIRNLLDNAARFAASSVKISCAQDATGTRITISDDGPGVAPEDRMRVFNRFERLGNERVENPKGTGLGLPVARSIIEHHGGTVAFVDSEMGGATVRIELPPQD